MTGITWLEEVLVINQEANCLPAVVLLIYVIRNGYDLARKIPG